MYNWPTVVEELTWLLEDPGSSQTMDQKHVESIRLVLGYTLGMAVVVGLVRVSGCRGSWLLVSGAPEWVTENEMFAEGSFAPSQFGCMPLPLSICLRSQKRFKLLM